MKADTDVDVLIVGAGPTGLVAAIEALRHGLSVRVVDQNERRRPHSKALVLHSRSLEVLDDLGCVAAVLEAGREFRALNIIDRGGALGRIAFRELAWGDAPYPMWLTIPQSETERCLEERLEALGGRVERQLTLRTLREVEGGVDVELLRADGRLEVCRAAWLVGCDGAKSDVRRNVGVELEGDTSGEVFMLADVTMESPLVDAEGYNVLAREGVLLIVPMKTPGQVRLIAHLPGVRPDQAPAIDLPMLQRLVDTRTGLPTKLSSLGWTSVFSPKHFLAKSLRAGRVFLAGDAAHIHSPVGGQGLNTGIQDAYNLMWKLALVQRGLAPGALLDTYEAERHPVGERMIRGVRRATRGLTLRAGAAQWARNRLASLLLRFARVRNLMGAALGMLQLRYAPGLAASTSPLAGSPRPGERATQQAASPGLTHRLRGAHHTLLLFDGPREALAGTEVELVSGLARTLAAPVEVIHVRKDTVPGEAHLADPDGAIHRAFGADRPLAVWIRPDKVVAFRGDPRATGPLRAWLSNFLSPQEKHRE
ncbi:MAG: FAD-dependent monooxygenase [Archangium sp.]|nr:FAD-dependent monooxygenase [Archangium sp.]